MHNSKIGKITYSKSQFITTYGNSKNKRLKKKKNKNKRLNMLLFLKKTLWSLFMDGVQLSWLEPPQGGSLLFNTKFPDIPRTHFTDL